jgi:hypothetical protein
MESDKYWQNNWNRYNEPTLDTVTTMVKTTTEPDSDFESELDQLCGFMENSANVIEVDRRYEMVSYGRKTNEHLQFFNNFSIQKHEKLVNDIQNIFFTYKSHFIDCYSEIDNTPHFIDCESDFEYELPMKLKRTSAIKAKLVQFLSIVNTNWGHLHLTKLRNCLIIARQVFIQFYFYILETDLDLNKHGNLEYMHGSNIYNYKRPVEFNELDELNELSGQIEQQQQHQLQNDDLYELTEIMNNVQF